MTLDDDALRLVIGASRTLRDAAEALGMPRRRLQRHATRLGAKTRPSTREERRTRAPDDETIRRVVAASSGLDEAATALGISRSAANRCARQVGVTTRTHAGHGRRKRFLRIKDVLPDDEVLREIIRSAPTFEAVVRDLDVNREGLRRKAAELGVRPQWRIRAGLPNDEELRRRLWSCDRLQDLADEWGVATHTVRNQLRRLAIPAPSKRTAP